MAYNPDEPRNAQGEWATGGGSRTESHSAPVPEQKPGTRAERAKAAHVMVDKTIQRYAEEHNEPRFAEAVGGESYRDSEPVDVGIRAGGRVAHGLELKTMVSNSNNKITMKSSAMEKKKAWQEQTGAAFHTVVLDDQNVFQAKGQIDDHTPGTQGYADLHDASKRQIYYKRGAGSFRVNGMHPVADHAELLRLLDTPDDKLPEAARPTKTWLEIKGVAGKRTGSTT